MCLFEEVNNLICVHFFLLISKILPAESCFPGDESWKHVPERVCSEE
jgi:hypothetical protein